MRSEGRMPGNALVLDGLVLPGVAQPLHLHVAGGTWQRLALPDADAAAACFARLDDLGAAVSAGAGTPGGSDRIVVVTCRLDTLDPLRVLDVLLLARQPPQRGAGWLAALGSKRAVELQAEEAAAARALAGRAGLGPWVDQPATGLPPAVTALVDTTRGIAAASRAVVWRRPTWLTDQEQTAVARLLAEEGERLGYAVLELTDRPAPAD